MGKSSSKHFNKSYFTYDKNNTLIQVMYLSELAADSGQNYLTMGRESKEPNYIDTLAKLVLDSFKGSDYEFKSTLKDSGFTHFQIILVYNDNTKSYSKRIRIN